MADTLVPWLLDYVLSIAETYGANIFNVPSHTKGKKVQVTEASSHTRHRPFFLLANLVLQLTVLSNILVVDI
jgi:hypothetical protein